MCGGWDIRNAPTYATETGISANLMGHWAHMQTLLPLRSCFFPLPLFIMNARAKHENDLIFKRMNVQVACIFIRMVWHKESFC